MSWIHDIQTITVEQYLSIVTEQTTGGNIWQAAHELLRYLEQIFTIAFLPSSSSPPKYVSHSSESSNPPHLVSSTGSCLNILELGSGTGYVGMTVARNLSIRNLVLDPQRSQKPSFYVCMTEMIQGGALSSLNANFQLNTDRLLQGTVSILPFDWRFAESKYPAIDGESQETGLSSSSQGSLRKHNENNKSGEEKEYEEQEKDRHHDHEIADDSAIRKLNMQDSPEVISRIILETPWDYIFGSDLLYYEDGVYALTKVFKAFLSRKGHAPRLIYAHTRFRYENIDILFFEQLHLLNIQAQKVIIEGDPSPPESPLPYTDLFHPLRVEIYEITNSRV